MYLMTWLIFYVDSCVLWYFIFRALWEYIQMKAVIYNL